MTLLDITSAFGVFATEGLRQISRDKKVEDAKGSVLFELKTVSPKRVLSDDVAYLVSHILSAITTQEKTRLERDQCLPLSEKQWRS